jgi:hypothetical protein
MEHLFDGWMAYFCVTSSVEVSKWSVCDLDRESMKSFSQGSQQYERVSMQKQVPYVQGFQ